MALQRGNLLIFCDGATALDRGTAIIYLDFCKAFDTENNLKVLDMALLATAYRTLHLSWGNSRHIEVGLRSDESGSVEKDLKERVDEKLSMSWQCALAA